MLKNWSDQKIEIIVGQLLRVGVLLSASVVFVGGCIYLARHGGSPVNYGVFQGEPADLRSIVGILRFAAGMHGRGIIQLGLLLLIATPLARVAFSIWAFAEEHRESRARGERIRCARFSSSRLLQEFSRLQLAVDLMLDHVEHNIA